MATAAVTGSDLTNLRTGDHIIDDVALHITPLVTVQTGTVSSVPTFSPYTQVGITWDGSHSDVSVGQMVTFASSGDVIAYAVVRKAPTASILYISTTPIGGSGYASDIQSAIAVSDTVTVYNHRPLWGMPSRIASRTFYKQWDVAYTNQNSQPPPVANAGAWQAAQVAVGASASFQLPRSGTNTSFNFGSATTSSRLWTLPSGVTLQGGYSTSDDVIEVDADAGRHLISYTHTDSNGKSHTAYTWLFVSDGSTGASLSERYSVNINSDTQTTQGRVMSFTITGDDLNDVLYQGAGVLFREWSLFNGSSLTDGVLIDTFIGYIASDLEITHDGNIGTATFTVESPFLYAARIPQPSQVLVESASPSNWSQATSSLTNPRGFLYYAIKWHTPTLLDMHDLDAPYTEPRRKDARWQQGSLQSAMQTAAEYLAGTIGSSSDGTTVLRSNPLYMDNTDRNAIANIITWLDRDIQAPLVYTRRYISQLAEVRSGAFAYNGTQVKAWLAGKFWNQGVGTGTMPNFTVTTSDGLARVLEVVGHFYAEQNRDIIEYPIALNRNRDIIDPAYRLWNSLTISSDFDTYGDGISSVRGLVIRVEREWQNDQYGWRKSIQLGMQPETFGQPAEEIPIANAKSYQLNGYSITTPSNFEPNQDDSAFGGAPIMLALTSNNTLGITYNYLTQSPQWASLSPFVDDESINDFSIDFNSDYFQNGNNPSYALGLYVVTTSGTTLNVWYFPDILNSTSGSIINSETMNDSSNTSEARIEVSETTPTLVIVAWHDQTGVELTRSTNGGSSWSSKANIGSAITDTDNDNAAIGLDIDGTNQIITAPNSSGEYGLYLATTAGGSFSRLSNSVASDSPYQMVKIIPDTDDVYASTGDAAITSDTITFNSAVDDYDAEVNASQPSLTRPYVWIDYLGGIGSVPTIASTGGNPTYHVERQPDSSSSTGQILQLKIIIASNTSPTPNTVTSLQFDYYVNSSSASKFQIYVNVDDEDDVTNYDHTITGLTGGSWQTVNVNSDIPFPIDIGKSSSTGNDIFISFQANTTIDWTTENADIRFDNIVIGLTDPFAAGGGSSVLYKITDFDGVNTWTDITPASNEIPVRPHDLALDIVNSDTLNTHIPTSNKWYQSTNAGSGWTTVATSSDKRVFYSAGTAILAGGTGTILLSLDGTTYEDKAGDFAIAVGAMGTIKRIQPL